MKDKTFRLWSLGRILGAAGSVLLLVYSIVPPVWDITHGPCDLSPTCPAPIDHSAVLVLGILSVYCLIVGFFVGRSVDRAVVERRSVAAAFFVPLGLFGAVLWMMIHAAFW